MKKLLGLLSSLCASCGGAAASGGHGHGHGQGHGDGPMHHGHSFAHAEEWVQRFEGPERDAWQKPDDVIRLLALPQDAIVADIGSATGYFPVRLARAVPKGRVWGVDIEPDMVRYLNARARREGLPNLFSILSPPSEPLLPEPVDLVMVVDTYHHIENRPEYFGKLAAHLRPGARLVIIDFKKGDLPVGPPDEMKLSDEVVTRELSGAGYRLQQSADVLPHQYVLIFTRA